MVNYLRSQGIEVGSGKNVTYNTLPFLTHEMGVVPFVLAATNLLNRLQEEAAGIVNVNLNLNPNLNPNLKSIYNLSGQRLKAPQKGINIINGRKVLVR